MSAPTEYDWDEAKSEATLAKRGFDFARASLIFDGPVVEEPDRRWDYGEIRIRAIGEVGGRVLVVVYTDRERSAASYRRDRPTDGSAPDGDCS
jgi:hypothetical protein